MTEFTSHPGEAECPKCLTRRPTTIFGPADKLVVMLWCDTCLDKTMADITPLPTPVKAKKEPVPELTRPRRGNWYEKD